MKRQSFSFTRLTYLLCIAVLCFAKTTYGQYEYLLGKSYVQRAEDIKRIYANVLAASTSQQSSKVIDTFALFAQHSGDKELQLEAELMRTYCFAQKLPAAQVIAGYESIIEQARLQGITQIAARTLDVMGQFYWGTVKNYELAFEKYIALSQLLSTVPDAAYPDKMASLKTVGEAYYYFGDYGQAIGYLEQAARITITPFNHDLIYHVFNTIGLSYQKLSKLDSADYYFHIIIDAEQIAPNSIWQNIAKGNLGYSHFLRGNYTAAIPLLQADIDGAVATEDWGLAAGSLIPLATIYLHQNEVAKADKLAAQAQEYVQRSGQYKRYQYLYPLLAKLYVAKGNAALATRYIDSTNTVTDSLSHTYNTLQLLRAHQRVELQQQKALQDNLTYQKRIKVLERNALLAIIGLLFTLLLFVYYTMRRKYRQEQALKDSQLHEKERKLQLAADQLHEFTQNIQEKNRLIENMEQQFHAAENNTILEQLRQSTILTDVDWEKFRALFEQVHSGFLNRLRNRFPHLTPAETRFLVLSKLGFSTKEMAAALGVSPQSIRTIWYRIRKKHQLPEESGQEELTASI